MDLKEKHNKNQVQGHFSDTLIDAIHETIKDKGQVLVFQNKRGYAPTIHCNSCGTIPIFFLVAMELIS